MGARDFRLIYVSVSLTFPPLPRFRQGAIKRFAAEIDNEHPFESVENRSDAGGVLETEGRRWLRIDRDGLEFQERSVEEGWDVVSRNAVDLVERARKSFQIPFYLVSEIIVRALSPVEPEASKLLQERALGVNPEQYQLLGKDVRGGSVTVVGTHEDPEFNWSVEIAPYLSDETNVWIEVESHPLGLGTDVDEGGDEDDLLSEGLHGTYKFLNENVMTFIANVLD